MDRSIEFTRFTAGPIWLQKRTAHYAHGIGFDAYAHTTSSD